MCEVRCAPIPCCKVKGDTRAAGGCFVISHVIGMTITWVTLFIILWATRWKSDIHQTRNPGSVGDLYQIVADWNSVPFVSLQVV